MKLVPERDCGGFGLIKVNRGWCKPWEKMSEGELWVEIQTYSIWVAVTVLWMNNSISFEWFWVKVCPCVDSEWLNHWDSCILCGCESSASQTLVKLWKPQTSEKCTTSIFFPFWNNCWKHCEKLCLKRTVILWKLKMIYVIDVFFLIKQLLWIFFVVCFYFENNITEAVFVFIFTHISNLTLCHHRSVLFMIDIIS